MPADIDQLIVAFVGSTSLADAQEKDSTLAQHLEGSQLLEISKLRLTVHHVRQRYSQVLRMENNEVVVFLKGRMQHYLYEMVKKLSAAERSVQEATQAIVAKACMPILVALGNTGRGDLRSLQHANLPFVNSDIELKLQSLASAGLIEATDGWTQIQLTAAGWWMIASKKPKRSHEGVYPTQAELGGVPLKDPWRERFGG